MANKRNQSKVYDEDIRKALDRAKTRFLSGIDDISDEVEDLNKQQIDLIKKRSFYEKNIDKIMDDDKISLSKRNELASKLDKKISDIDDEISDLGSSAKDRIEELSKGTTAYWDELSKQQRRQLKDTIDNLNATVDSTDEAFDKIRGNISDNLDELSEGMNKTFSERLDDLSDSLREWSDTFNLSAITDSLSETVDSYVENVRQMRAISGDWFDEKAYNKAVKSMTNTLASYSYNESSEFLQSFMSDFALKGIDDASTLAPEIAASVKAFGTSVDDYSNLLWRDRQAAGGDLKQQGETIKYLDNIAGYMQDNEVLNVKANALISAVNENANALMGMAYGNKNRFKTLVKSVSQIEALDESAANEGLTPVLEMLKDYTTMSRVEINRDDRFSEFANLTGLTADDIQAIANGKSLSSDHMSYVASQSGMSVSQLQDAINSGGIAGLSEVYQSALKRRGGLDQDIGTSLVDMSGGVFSNYHELSSFLSMNPKDLDSEIKATGESIDKAVEASTAQSEEQANGTGSGLSIAESKEKETIGPFEWIKNKLSNLAAPFTNFFSELNVSWANAAHVATVASLGAKGIAKGKKFVETLFSSGFGSAVKGLFEDDTASAIGEAVKSALGGGTDVATDTTVSKGVASGLKAFFGKISGTKIGQGIISLGSNIKNFISAGLGGAGADTAAGAAGMKLFGFGAEGGMATLGTGGFMSAGLLATLATGVVGAAMTIKDAIGGVKKSQEWLGSNSTGSKVASGIGGAIGGTGPGLGDEGSAGSKALNIAGNVGKGAALGAALGSIIPGLGTAIGAAIGAGVGGITGAIGGKTISKGFSKAGSALKGLFTETIPNAFNMVTDNIGGFFTKKLPKAFNSYIDMQKKFILKDIPYGIGFVAGKVKDFFTSIPDALSKLFEGIKSFIFEGIPKALTEIGSFFTTAWSNLKTGVATFFTEGLPDLITSVGTGIKNFVTEIIPNVLSAIGNGVKNGIEAIPKAGKAVVDTAKSGLSAVGGWFSDRWNDIKTNISTIGESAKTNISTIGESAKSGFVDGSHANGLNYVPKDGYIAELHKGESVLPKNEADRYRSGMGQSNISILNSLVPIKGLVSSVDELKKTITDRFTEETKENKSIVKDFKTSGIFGKTLNKSSKNIFDNVLKGLFGNNTTKKLKRTFSKKGIGSKITQFFSKLFGGESEDDESTDNGGSSGSGGVKGVSGKSNSGTGLDVLAPHPDPEGTDYERWRPYAVDALKANGLSTDDAMVNKVMSQINLESGGDPTAINLWDSNAAAGTPSKGLLQTIDSTFNSNKFEGHDDIWNGYDNMLAAINYAKNRYGGGKDVSTADGTGGMGSGHGYAVGTPWIPDDQVALIHQGEMIVPKEKNPLTNPVSTVPVNNASGDTREVIQVLQWQQARVESKLDEVIAAIRSSGGNTQGNVSSIKPAYKYNSPSDVAYAGSKPRGLSRV